VAIVIKALIALAVVGFILAVVGTYVKVPLVGVEPEGFSRGCENLALIAIALSLAFKDKS